MSKREKLYLALFIITAVLFLFSISVKIARSQERLVEGPQVVMRVIPGALGPWLAVEPQDVTVSLGLVPENPEDHYAPLSPGDTLLCHSFTPDGTHYGYRCGMNRYMVTRFDVFPKHKSKKEKDSQ